MLDSLGKRMDSFETAKADSKPGSGKEPDDGDDERDGDDFSQKGDPMPLAADARPARFGKRAADSVRADAATEQEEIEHFKTETGVARPIAADSVLATIQASADRAASAWGKSAAHPWDGESIASYRRRTARDHQAHSPQWREVDLAQLHGQTLRNATAQIFSDSIAASTASESNGETLREVRRRDDFGRLVREFYGSPAVWLREFSGGPPRIARLIMDGDRRR